MLKHLASITLLGVVLVFGMVTGYKIGVQSEARTHRAYIQGVIHEK